MARGRDSNPAKFLANNDDNNTVSGLIHVHSATKDRSVCYLYGNIRDRYDDLFHFNCVLLLSYTYSR